MHTKKQTTNTLRYSVNADDGDPIFASAAGAREILAPFIVHQGRLVVHVVWVKNKSEKKSGAREREKEFDFR